MYGRTSRRADSAGRLLNNGTNIRPDPKHADMWDTAFGLYAGSRALRDYAACLADPLGATPAPVPFGPGLPECAAFRSYVEGQSDASSTTGIGAVTIFPLFINDESGGAAAGTTSAYTGTGFPTLGNTGYTAFNPSPQLPYSASQLGTPSALSVVSSRRARLVVARLEVKVVTAHQNIGGKGWLISASGIQPAGMTTAQVSQLAAVGLAYPIDMTSKRWQAINWQPALLRDFLYPENTVAGSYGASTPPSVNNGGNCAGLTSLISPVACYWTSPLVAGAISPISMEWRYTIVVEYTGFGLTGAPPNTITSGAPHHDTVPFVSEMVHRAMRAGRHLSDEASVNALRRTADATVSAVTPQLSWRERTQANMQPDPSNAWNDRLASVADKAARMAWENRDLILAAARPAPFGPPHRRRLRARPHPHPRFLRRSF